MSSTNTMKSWEVLIKTYDELPAFFKTTFESLSIQGEVFPYTIYLPKDKNHFTKRNDMLIIVIGKELHIFEKAGSNIKKVMFRFEDINCIERGFVLLHSWIKLTGISDGTVISYKIDFNTVTEKLFICIINLIRFSTEKAESLTDIDELARLDYLNSLSYKFYSYSLDALAKGQRIINSFFQPEIIKDINSFSHKMLSPNRSIILTDNELIIVSEEQGKSKSSENYGVIYNFIPLSMIYKLTSLLYRYEKNIILKINTVSNYNIELYCSEDNRDNIEGLIENFNQIYKK